ncbi:hypothetical protein Dimus_021324 [Dionaea muscipula]
MSRRRREDLETRPSRRVGSLREEAYPKPSIEARDERHPRHHARRSRSPPDDDQWPGRVMVRSGNSAEGAGRVVDRDRRSRSMERREYELHVNYGRSDRLQSRKPHIVERELAMEAMPPAVELHRRYLGRDYVDYDDEEKIVRVRNAYNYDDNQLAIGKEDVGRRFLVDSSDRGKSVKNPMDATDGGGGGEMVTSSRGYRYTQDYPESSDGYSSRDIRRFKDKSERYQGLIPDEKLLTEGYYNDEKSYVYHSRDVSYPLSPIPQFKAHGSEHIVRGNPSTTSRITMMDEFSGNLRDFHPSPKEGHKRRYGELSEPIGGYEYDQQSLLNLRKDYEAGHLDTTVCSHCNICTSTRAEHEGYLYSNSKNHDNHDSDYISDSDFCRKMPIYVQADHEDRNLPRAVIADPTLVYINEAEGSHRHLTSRLVRDVEHVKKEGAPNYSGMRRTLRTSLQAEEYLDSGDRDTEFLRISMSQGSGMPDSGSASVYLEYPNAGSHTQAERVKTSPGFIINEEMERFGGGPERIISNQHVVYHRASRREYDRDVEISRTDARRLISGKWNEQSRNHRIDSGRDEWISRNSSCTHSKEPSGDANQHHLESELMFDEKYRHEESTKQSRFSYEGKPETEQRHSIKSYKPATTYLRGHSKPEYPKGSSRSHYANQRSDVLKHDKVWKRTGDDYRTTTLIENTKRYEHLEGPLRPDPPEESKDFKHMVHAAFLDFSKRMNENPVAQKLYKEEGKSGNLICVVCKRSQSKKFQDTQSLVKHACMCRKVGLRALHLGLQKAICVLMGWNTVMPHDIASWTPETLPKAEALAQREDLILWPPIVVVHNISLSNSNHNEWKLIDIEALGSFLADKGFKRGKMRICLGYPGDQSVMVVKFMGTFSGFHQAEKLHQYFAEQKRGRTDFEDAMIEIGKAVAVAGNENQGDTAGGKPDESLLYGYIGITEDLPKVDSETKKRGSVKSKKEILDLDTAPLKPE